MLRNLSLALLALGVGGVLTVVGFVAYFNDNATLNLAGFFYGIPVLLGGLALKAAELEPTPLTQVSSEETIALRERQATPIQNQIRKDVSRYRYGQKVHLEEALERLGLSPNDEVCPVLEGIREEAIEGNYALILEFNSPNLALEMWQEKQEKIEKFFGPGVRSRLSEVRKGRVEVALIAIADDAA
ncbi:DUF2854 domain-containing protein [Oxynema sp. CENA135]|uniref:DUF2854 domain-containing protein n=1 Tax=Oxynema sp. CENA135 TaxID=984206 RepID=UPI00190A7BCE|nr:DUF2854 domain-containing protein [Oxynema sp. CENA135]MBK4730983.1 DUF2854 domain-containing protein [Oxynema sp. CENA135]